MYLNGLYVFYITLAYNLIIKYTRVISKIGEILLSEHLVQFRQYHIFNVLGKTLDSELQLAITEGRNSFKYIDFRQSFLSNRSI